jgi:hypothetical protein
MRNFLFAALLIIPTISNGQTRDTTMVSIPRSALTPQQLKQVDVQEAGAWVGLGKEVGEAINSSLSAVTDNTAKFADTKVGKFTMFIIAWKVLAQDFMGVLWAFFLASIGFPTLIWSYRRWTRPTFLKSETRNEKGKVIERIYEDRRVSDYEAAAFIHALVAAGLIIACSVALFGGC